MKDGIFEIGDVVYLKSGSQKLVVTQLYTEDDGYLPNTVGVTWMVYESQIMREYQLPSAALELASDKGSR